MLPAQSLWIGLALLITFFLSRPARAQFEELAAKVPSTANAIVLLDAQKLMASKLAQTEGWKDKYEQAFAMGLVSISPHTERMILAAQIDVAHVTPLWELAVADFDLDRSVVDIAKATKGALDNVNGLPAVVLSDNSYCVHLKEKQLGVYAPANRQSVSRWLRETSSRSEPGLSPYLRGTFTAVKTSQIVIAFDLEDSIPVEIVRERLGSSEVLAGKSVDLEAAAKALAGIRGVVLEVAVTDGAFGRAMVHFSQDASVLAPFAKPLLLEVLGNQGAMIDDIADWKVTTEPERFTFTGPLSLSGRKRVLSLIDHPTAALIASDSSRVPAGQSESSKAAYATAQYFKSIQTIRDDVREQAKDAKTFGQNAMWLDNWARRIDRLPILDVDPEMLAYGRYVTTRMRDASAALKGIGINSAARQAQVYQQYSGSYSGGFYGYGGGYNYNVQWNNV
jgi:hypothetical protein